MAEDQQQALTRVRSGQGRGGLPNHPTCGLQPGDSSTQDCCNHQPPSTSLRSATSPASQGKTHPTPRLATSNKQQATSRLTTHDSRLTTHDSRLTTHDSRRKRIPQRGEREAFSRGTKFLPRQTTNDKRLPRPVVPTRDLAARAAALGDLHSVSEASGGSGLGRRPTTSTNQGSVRPRSRGVAEKLDLRSATR